MIGWHVDAELVADEIVDFMHEYLHVRSGGSLDRDSESGRECVAGAGAFGPFAATAFDHCGWGHG